MATDALEILAANLPQVAYLYAGEARALVYVSPQIELLTGCTPAGLLTGALPLLDLCHPEDQDRVELTISAALADRRDFCVAYRMQHTDGSWRWVEDRGRGVYDERALTYLAGTLVDISERVAGEGRRREFDVQRDRADKLESLSMLAGGIAHEFNNALLAIMGNLELARLNVELGERIDELLDDALVATHRAADKTRELLIYSGRGRGGLESGRGSGRDGPSRDEPVAGQRSSFDEIVDGLRKLLEASVRPEVELQFELGPRLPVEVDRALLQQALLNLVSNADDAVSGRPGHVTVRTGVMRLEREAAALVLPGPIRSGTYAFVEVEDDGVGIDEPTRARMFDPFFSTKPQRQGLGSNAVLGLVRSHAGGVQLDTRLGEGTRVRVLLPPRVEAPRPVAGSSAVSPASKPPDAPPSSRTATVLVVDDEQMIRRMIRGVLESFGCRVIEGADRDQGQSLISAHADAIDLAILDVNLPQGKGTELFSQLRARRPRVPVLFSSGFEQPDVSRGDDPTVSFLAKPYRSQALVEHVTTLLDLGSS